MEALSLSRTPSGTSFRSRRSHTSLQHISLAPLTSRIPLDDDDDDRDYFTRSEDGTYHPAAYIYNPHPATRTYLSSASVPTTPPLLSESPNVPRRKRTSARSDTNLSSLNLGEPLHPRHRHHHRSKSTTARVKSSSSQDSEWVLRAGLALAASAREEKGQTWLLKRESSTSLVSDSIHHDDERRRNILHEHSGRRNMRSGRSTPRAHSRRGSSGSHYHSRADLSMTSHAPTAHTSRSGFTTPANETVGMEPDFVDENIRDEMASLSPWLHRSPRVQRSRNSQDRLYYSAPHSRRGSVIDPSFSAAMSEASDSEFDEDDEEDEEADEVELQRLTRERGFGLGSWIDRLVEWTLFTVEDDIAPESISDPTRHVRYLGDIQILQSMTNEPIQLSPIASEDDESDTRSEFDFSEGSQKQESRDDVIVPTVEKASDQGGWADVGWFLRVAKNAVL
ncbi:hypothetical protein AJ80_00729 [Polytolypa hystricis UAMH7299]|uniref:Uncharacterized protein n=1 Tax=Polytolypa hystricis (strain UAMH7299) TaxID=1447883 RepID=A0A2B7Z2Y7_POLH7|nr:hypothetical protein AJ80_00729 [Polytolypa hystricis UAMH7299]